MSAVSHPQNNRRRGAALALAVLAALVPVRLAWAADAAVIVMYHRFGEGTYPSTNTRLDQLDAHIAELARGGYTVRPLAEIVAALEAGVQCLRLNPGNIRRPEHIKAVATECLDREVPIRIGVNGGSLDPRLYEKHGGRVTPEAMVESAMEELAYFEDVGFDDVKVSVKASNVPLMIEAYRQLSEVTDHPLHLGVTEAGPPPAGVIKSTAGIATLLAEGIGDTIRYSLTADPVEEARAGRQLLEALGLRQRKNVDLIACPSCGRAEIDVFRVAEEAQAAFADRELPLQVAVMGCVVNGPGEARGADLGIAAGKRRGHLFVKGRNAAVVPEDEMVEALVEWADFIAEHGTDAALERVDLERAAREAEADRAELLATQGDDANASEERVNLIRKRA